MEQFMKINTAVNGFVWGPVMLALLVGTGIYLSIAVGFIQFTKIGYWWKNTIGKIFKKGEAGDGEITPLQAVSTALASTVGTGNIAGVTGAIILGGPGAVFWMWVSALFGMVTKFSEVTLAVKYRERNEKGDWCGGPMYYIKNGLGPKWNVARHRVRRARRHRGVRHRQHRAGQLHRGLRQVRRHRVQRGRGE